MDITTTTYVIGDDVLAQASSDNIHLPPPLPTHYDPQYLLYDGHGSTRQLSDSSGDLITDESYSYDAYGVMLGGNPGSPANPSDPSTHLLYAGEYFDTDAQQYYNRARWYDPTVGRFNRMDPFAGNPQDPQSLHKYLYAHANPINRIDPFGYSSIAIGGLTDLAGAIGIASMLTALTIAAIIAAVLMVDYLFDEFRKRSVIWHVRDYTLLRLAETFNAGALRTPTSPHIYFTPIFIAPNDLANIVLFQIVKSAVIITGFGTQAAIDSFIYSLGMTPTAVAAIDPTLAVPSHIPIIIISAPIGSVFAGMFGGGIAVRWETGWPFRAIIKTMVTLPGEYVASGKYKSITW